MQNLSKDTLVYVGTSGPKSKGIYFFRLQTDNLEVSQNITLVPLGLAAETPNPNFIDIDLKRRLVFAATRVDRFDGKPGGAVSSFSVDSATGKLNLINQTSCMGRGPCHLALDATGRNVVVSMCDSGGVAVIPVAPDGKLGEATGFATAHRQQRQSQPSERSARALRDIRPRKPIRIRLRPGSR